MNTLIVGDHETLAREVRRIINEEGIDLPTSRVVSLALAKTRLLEEPPELAIIILPPDPEPALVLVLEARTIPGVKILVVGAASDTKLVLRSLRTGADDYIDQDDLEPELKSALARLRLEQAGSPVEKVGSVIAVLAPSGGSGSSTLAANIAICLARQHTRSALFDLRLESGDLCALLDLHPTYTLSDLCQNASRLDQVMLEHSMVRHSSGVHLVASPKHLADVRLVNAEGVRRTLLLARASFPYVILDVDRNFRDEQLQALTLSDIILIVIRLDFLSLRNANRTIEQLDRSGVERERIRLVINRKGMPREVPIGKVEEALRMKSFTMVPDDARSVNRAINTGIPLVIDSPYSKISKSVVKLARSVNGQHATKVP